MFSSLMTVVWFLVAITILVAVHELGHFWVARKLGVKVLRFSVGFGPRLFSWHDSRGTEFALSAIPLGGYVKMLDEREGEVPEEEKQYSFNSKHPWQRIAIAFAGPAINFVLALLLYWFIFLRGTLGYSPVIGHVVPGSIAESAGLESGQEIIEVDGKPVSTRRDVMLQLLSRLGESGEINFTVRYPDSSLSYRSSGELKDWMRGVADPDVRVGLGIEFYRPSVRPVIHEITPRGPAAEAGMLSGDELVRADKLDLDFWQDWVDYVQQRPGVPIVVEFKRDGSHLFRTITPAYHQTETGEEVGRVGMSAVLPPMPADMVRAQDYTFGTAIAQSFRETAETTLFVFESLKKLIVGQISTRNLSGPIGIAQVAADQAETGLWAFVSFLAHLSIVLGVLNLLPIPILDGGHILYYLLEWVKGSPLSERIQVFGYQLGMGLLLFVMVIAFYNDISKLQ